MKPVYRYLWRLGHRLERLGFTQYAYGAMDGTIDPAVFDGQVIYTRPSA